MRSSIICLLCHVFAVAGKRPADGPFHSVPGVASAVPTFDEFIKLHGRTYEAGSAEYEQRRQLYRATVREVEAHNRDTDRMWTSGVNIMSDRTEAEITAFNGFRKAGYTSVSGSATSSSFISMSGEPGDEKDLGYVMPKDHSWESVDIDGDKKEEKVEALANIRSQKCGNCWAAATNAMMEAHRQLHGGIVGKFDDDELTECSQNAFNCGGSGGCQGSTPELALMHYQKNGMLLNPDKPTNSTARQGAKTSCPPMTDIVDKAEKAPHEIKDGMRQAADNSPARHFGLIGWEKLPENQGWPIMLALYERGPVAVAVATDGWRQYSSGVYGGCDKNGVIGHSVLAFGFGQVSHKGKTVKYWRLQNSWGPSFGENGHFRMLRHDADDAYCGTDERPKDGTGCDGGPSSVKVCGMCGVLYDALVPYSEPVTYLAKQLQERRSTREAAERKGSGRIGRAPNQNVISVDGEGGAAPVPLGPVPSVGQMSGKMRSTVVMAVIFVVAVVFGLCWSGQDRSKASGSFKGPSV